MKHVKVLVVVAVLIVVAVLLKTLSSHGKTAGGGQAFGRGMGSRGPVPVQIAQVTTGPIQLRRELTGTVKASYTYVVAAKVSGRLVSLSKRIGDKVATNEIVGRIDDTEYRQAYEEAQAQVKVSRASVAEAQAQLTYTKKELQREKDLVEKGIASQAELDNSQRRSMRSRQDTIWRRLSLHKKKQLWNLHAPG